MGLDEILKSLGFSPSLVNSTCAMTLNRLIHPAAEYAMPDWIRSTAMADILGVDFSQLPDDPLYRNLDRLHPHRAAIESALAQREQSLFNLENTVLLYDLTSTYFEGKADLIPKAKRGYSRDHRPDCKQVVVGLVIGREGFPRAHEIFEGNAQDRKTLATMLDLLEKRVGLPEGSTIVVDRGMAFAENIAELRRRNLRYVVAARQKERDRYLAEFETGEGFEEVIRQPSPRNPDQKKSAVRVKAHSTDKEMLILCISSERVEKDRAIRTKQEGRFLRDVAKLQASNRKGPAQERDQDRRGDWAAQGALSSGGALSRVDLRHQNTTTRRINRMKRSARSRRASMAATCCAPTVRSFRPRKGGGSTRSLTRAENAFRCMKSPLSERPIFHHIEHRVESHIFLCVLAYHLLVAIETTLLRQDIHTSWATCARPAGDSRDCDDCSADRPERSSADSA